VFRNQCSVGFLIAQQLIACALLLPVERLINKTSFMNTPKITLINAELKKQFALTGSQEDVSDPVIVAKFFNPCGSQTWYAISYDETSNCCFGYVTGMFEDELGYFSINELESLLVPPFGMRIEQDLFFKSCRLSEIKLNRL
jgi:hypothetical protein